MFSMCEILLTALAVFVGSWFTVRFNIPILIQLIDEWVDDMRMDDTTEGSDDHDAG